MVTPDNGPLSLVAAAYGVQIRQHGPCPNGVLWGSLEGQQSRFRRMAAVMGADRRRGPLTINDLGCGYGAFFEFLEAKPPLVGGRYYGYDICAEMIAAARDRIADPRATFLHSMVATETADYAFACGTFNLKGPAPDDDWSEYVKASLAQLWQSARKGIAFNLLDRAIAEAPQEWLYYADIDEIYGFCRRHLTPEVVRIDGRNPNDCTFLIRKA